MEKLLHRSVLNLNHGRFVIKLWSLWSREDNSVPCRQVKRYKNTTDSYHPKYQGISAHFRSSGEFRCVSAVNLFPASTRWMSFFFFFGYLHIFIFGVLDDHDSPNFSLLDHPSLLSPFNRPDGSGGLSSLLFSFQQATPYFLYILEIQSPILF